MRFVPVMVTGHPRRMHHSSPGEIRSLIRSTFWAPTLSPGATSAPAPGDATASAAMVAPAIVDHQPDLLAMVRPFSSAVYLPTAIRNAPGSMPATPPRSLMPGVHQRGDREPVVGDAGLLALVEVPALLAREARARQRGLGRVLELHVDHDDRRDEAPLVRVLDHVGALEGLLPEADVVDPDL